ncbi:hypothetical protein V3C99_011199, partial [Haemonchus contortus]
WLDSNTMLRTHWILTHYYSHPIRKSKEELMTKWMRYCEERNQMNEKGDSDNESTSS